MEEPLSITLSRYLILGRGIFYKIFWCHKLTWGKKAKSILNSQSEVTWNLKYALCAALSVSFRPWIGNAFKEFRCDSASLGLYDSGHVHDSCMTQNMYMTQICSWNRLQEICITGQYIMHKMRLVCLFYTNVFNLLLFKH